jgi:hypothetical protein
MAYLHDTNIIHTLKLSEYGYQSISEFKVVAGRSVGIVRLRSKTTEFVFLVILFGKTEYRGIL